MSKKKTGKTVNGMRVYTCRLCGEETSLNVHKWIRLKQEHKRICKRCLDRMCTTEAERREYASAYLPGYMQYYRT